jgi:hypothetical protein
MDDSRRLSWRDTTERYFIAMDGYVHNAAVQRKLCARRVRCSVHVVHAPASRRFASVSPILADARRDAERHLAPQTVQHRAGLSLSSYIFRTLYSYLGLALVVGYFLLAALLFEFLEAGYELEQRGRIVRTVLCNFGSLQVRQSVSLC